MSKFLHFNVNVDKNAPTSFRKKFQSRTVAVDPVTYHEVRMIAQDFLNLTPSSPQPTVELNIGVTFLSLKDRYCKATGRNEAAARKAKTKIAVVGVTVNATHIFVHLQTYKGMILMLRTNKASNFTTVTGELIGG